jgi:putative acetyltransferase
MTVITIRRFRDEDAAATARVFYDAVHAGTESHYDEAQRHAWAPQVPVTFQWRERLASQKTLVAQLDGRIVGFISLASDGVIDLVFVAPEAAGKGVAAQLHLAMLTDASGMGLRRLCTQASRAARKFFERQGWAVVDEQAVSRNGVRLTNFVMERYLP